MCHHLRRAVQIGNISEVQRVLRDGADVNQRYTESGQTPLMAAAWFGHLLLIERLMEAGADKNATDTNGYGVLHYALCYNQVEVARYFLDQGVNIEQADNIHGFTSLAFAAVFGRIQALVLLMSYGANLYPQDNHGRSPMDLAKTEEIRQAIRDEEHNRDHRFKRIPAADLLPAQRRKEEEEDEDEDDESSSDAEEEEEDEED